VLVLAPAFAVAGRLTALQADCVFLLLIVLMMLGDDYQEYVLLIVHYKTKIKYNGLILISLGLSPAGYMLWKHGSK